MDGTGTTSFLEELTKTDDIVDIRGNGNYPPVPMEMQHQQQQYWQMGPGVPQGMNTRQPQYGQYGSMNKPGMNDMMSQRPGHGGYSAYGQGGQIINPGAIYGYGNQPQAPTNITPPRMGGGQGINPVWSHQSPGAADKPQYPGHSNLTSPQQQSLRMSGGMYPQGGMGYGDTSGMVPQPQRMHNYTQMQGNMSQHGMISPRGIPPQMIPGGRMQGPSGQYMYSQNSGDQPSRNENMQMNPGQPPSQGSAGNQFHSQNPGGIHPQQMGDPSSMQPPQQQQQPGAHHQMAMNVSGQYQMPGGMMGGQYGGGGIYRMQGYPPSNQQALMMSPGGPQQGMKGYQGQIQYGHNQGYWSPRQMNAHFQGDMAYHQPNPNQGSVPPAYNMMPHQQQMHQQQYLQTQSQQKLFPSQQVGQQQQLQHQHPPSQQLQQQQQPPSQQSSQQLSQPQQFQQQPQTPAPPSQQQHNSGGNGDVTSPQLPASQATIHHQATQPPQQNFSHQQYPSQPPQVYQQQPQMMSPHHPQQQFHPQQKLQTQQSHQQFAGDQPKLHSPPPSLNPQLIQQPQHQLQMSESQQSNLQQQKLSQQLDQPDDQQPTADAAQPQQQSGVVQSSPTPPQSQQQQQQQQRMRFLQQQQQMQQSPSMPVMTQQYSSQSNQMLQVKISSPQSAMEMPKLTSDNPSRPGSVQAPQLSPYAYRQPIPQQSQQQQSIQLHQQQQQYHLPHMDMDGLHGQFNPTSSSAGLVGELVSPSTEDMMSSNPTAVAQSGTLMQLGNVEDDEATLSTPPPPLLRSCVDFDSDIYMTGQSLPYPPAPQVQPQLLQQLHFPPSDDPFQPSSLERMTPGMMSVGPPTMQQHSAMPQQGDVGATNKKKRKACNEIDGELKPKRPRKSKKKKDSEDSVENIPTSSLEPDGIGGASGYLAAAEGIDAFSSDSSTVKSKKAKKSKDAKAEGSLGKRPKTPKKSKTPEEQEANRLMKLQLQSGEKRTKKKSDKKSKMMEGVNEVSSTVETSDPIMAYAQNLTDATNVVGTSAMDEPASYSEPSSDNLGVATTPVREGKQKIPVKPKSKKKKPLPTMFKSKKKKKTSYSGSDMEKTSAKDFSDDDNLNKRRSGRNTKRLKYMCDQDLSLSEDDNNVDAAAANNNNNNNAVMFEEYRGDTDTQIVDKVLGSKIVKRKVHRGKNKTEADERAQTKMETDDNVEAGKPEEEKADDLEEEKEEEVEMFYVKFKNFSYLHCEWKSADELEQGDKRVVQKIKRFKVKQQSSFFEQVEEDDYFNPDYVEVDRVLDLSAATDPVTGEASTHYLVKWRALPYEESTWELAQDVDKQKAEAFLRFKDPPPEHEREHKPRPSANEWKSHEECPQYKNGNTLREYQLEGLNWLTFSYFNKQSCILADEMGLGKTIQSITFVEEVSRYGIRGPFLIIVPLSTIANWQREFEAWTDLNVVVYHGSNASRSMLQQYEMYYRDAKGKRMSGVYKFNALITTFEVIISDLDVLKQIDWRIAVIDEAHRLKNRNCKLLQGLNSIDIEHRLLLTGTPLQNNVEELFSLLSFLEPKQFVSSEAFMMEFGKLETDTQVEKLKSLLKPVMLRRLKEDVEKSLAPKEETIIEVELTNVQKKYYRAILERNFAFLARGGSYASVPTLMNTMMELRKCCNHPFLINGAEDAILEEFQVSHAPQDSERLFHTMVQASGKLVLTDKLLPKLKADGHKVLIFSQMIRVLDVLEDYLIYKKYLYERIDGRIRGSLRQEAIDRFCKPDSDRFVFLLCTRAGGLGINLTAADTVIIYDSDWNPQNDLQAQARCHRIGQQKSVKVYRLITRNTYEREMFDRASLKLGLDKAVLQSMGPKDLNGSNQLSKKEIEDLLKKGAYGALMDDDNSTGNDFCEEDIDHILQRRTQVVQVQAGVKGSTFAKASFSLSTNRMDIDVDDPQFWQKWAKKADLDVDQLLSAADSKDKNALIIEMPRQRRQVSRYGKQDEPVRMSDLESSGSDDDDNRGSGKGSGGRKGRKGDALGEEATDENPEEDENQPKLKYTRNECYNVEKCILVFGWGRWSTILEHGRFKRKLNEEDVRNITRAILLYSLKHYDGDDKIKMFIYDLISPSEDGMEINCHNHSGLSAPVPRGRKGRRGSNKKVVESPAKKFDGDLKKIDLDLDRFISDPSYKKHLKRHANRVLLRIRLLFYLKHTIIGNQADKILSGAHSSEVDIMVPHIESDLPSYWWDSDCDKCMLVGVFKHGYERYAQMRLDSSLCFLSRCGPPPKDAAASSITDIDEHDDDEEMSRDDDDDEDTDSMQKPKKRGRNQPPKREQLPFDNPESLAAAVAAGQLPFPSVSDLNQRLRRIITAYQKLHKKELLRQEQREKRIQKREQFDQIMKEREIARKAALQNRWSRREEAEFYRLVSSFGVERDPKTLEFVWNRFRSLGHLDKKFDETLTEYYKAFIVMCNKVCKRNNNGGRDAALVPTGATLDDPSFNSDLVVEHITEERASRCLARVELLCRIRERVLTHPELESRLALCQSSSDLPHWWISGKHDKDLLLGVAKHGLTHMEATILCDPELSFYKLEKEVVRSSLRDAGTIKSENETENPPKLEKDVTLESKDDPSKGMSESGGYKAMTTVESQNLDELGDLDKSKENPEEGKTIAPEKDGVEEVVAEMSPCDRNDSSADTEEAKSKDGDDDDETVGDKDTAAEEDDVDKEVGALHDEAEQKNLSVGLESGDKSSAPMETSDSQETVGNEKLAPKTETCGEWQAGVETTQEDDIPARMDASTNDKDGSDAATDTTEVRGDKDSVEEADASEKKLQYEDMEKIAGDEASSHTLSADDNDKLDDLDDKQDGGNFDDNKDMPVLESELDVIVKKEEGSAPVIPLVAGSRQPIHDRRRGRRFTDMKAESSENASAETQDGILKFPEIYLPHWPKDRILIHRLENVCNCVERGEWPSVHKFLSNIGSSVGMATSSGSLGPTGAGVGSLGGGRDSHCSTPTIPDTPTTGGCATPILGLDLSYSNVPNPERISEALDGSIPKRRHRRTKAEMEADRTSRSGTPVDPAAGRLSLSDVLMTRRLVAGMGGKGVDEDSGTSSTEVMKDVDMMRVFKRRRGRKSKIDKMLEAAAIEAMVRGSAAHPDSLLGASGASSIYADWSKMLGQSPSTTPQPQPAAARDNSGKLGKEVKTEDKDALKFSAENLSSDCMPLALTSSSLASTQNMSNDATLSTTSSNLLNSMMSLSASLLKAPSQSSDDDAEHSIASRMMIGQHQSRSQQHSSSFPQSFKQSGSVKVSDLLQQRDSLKHMDDQAMEERIQSELEMVVNQRQKRRSRLDPSKIDVDSMDGSENVSVIDRTTGKKITGAKAPPIKHLQEWLLRNPTYDVDPKWSHIVKARVNLPAELQSRVLTPSGRGRKSNLPQTGSQIPSSSLSSNASGYPSSPFSGLGLLSSSGTTSSTSSTTSADYYNSMASFMAAASAGPSGSFMGIPNPFSPPLGALANSMYAASLAASMGLLPPIPGGSFGLDELTGPTGSSSMSAGVSSSKEEKKDSSAKKKGSERDECKKADDAQRKKSSKASSSSMATPDMDMNSLFGPSSFTPFMYNQLLLSQLYAQSLAAFNQMPGTPGFQSPTPFMSSFMPPPLPFDATLPSSSTSSVASGKHSSKQSQDDKKRPESTHRSSGKSTRDGGSHAASGGGNKTPSTSRKSFDDKIPKIYPDGSTSSMEKSKAHSGSNKHSPQSSRPDPKKQHPIMEDLFSSSLMPPPMLDMFGPNNSLLASTLGLQGPGHADDEPEDLSVSSKKKSSGKSDPSTSSMSLDKDPFSLSFKPPSLSSSRFPDDKALGALPFFMDPLVTPGAMSFLNPSMAFPDMNFSMKSPFEQMGLSSKRDDSKSSKKETVSSGGGSSKSSLSSSTSKKKESPPTSSSSSFPDPDPHSLMPQFMAQDFARYNFMDEQLRMMAPMDIPPFYLPSFTGFPGLYPDLGPPYGAKKSPECKEKTSSSSRKHGDGSCSSQGAKEDRKEKVIKKSQDHQETKLDFEAQMGVSRRLFSPDPSPSSSGGGGAKASAFNIDQLSIPAVPSDAPLFFPPPQPFSFSLNPEPRDKMENSQASGVGSEDKGSAQVGSNKSLTPKSRSKLGLIDSISSKLLARKQLSTENPDEEKDPSRSKPFDYDVPSLFSKPTPRSFEPHQQTMAGFAPQSPQRKQAAQEECPSGEEKNAKEGNPEATESEELEESRSEADRRE